MKYLRPRVVWISHLSVLLGMAAWIAIDPAFELMCERLRPGVEAPMASLEATATYVGWLRPAMLAVLLAGAGVSFSWILFAMFRRSNVTQQRSLKAVLALTAVVAIWCGIANNMASLAWQGKRIQLALKIEDFESIVQPLRNEWPANDGELPGIGPFMAYPFGRPSTLVLLRPPSVSSTELYVSAIERDQSGAIRLQLSGIHTGDWVEWHPEASRPQSFAGGLSDRYDIRSSASLGFGWYLVRYNA